MRPTVNTLTETAVDERRKDGSDDVERMFLDFT
jgi:hypothetical protein